MDRDERAELGSLLDEVQSWISRAQDVRQWHRSIGDAARAAEQELADRAVVVDRAGAPAWSLIPLTDRDEEVVRRLADRANLPTMTGADQDLLTLLTEDLRRAATDARNLVGVRRFFAGARRKQSALVAVAALRSGRGDVSERLGPARLRELMTPTGAVDASMTSLDRLADPALGFQPAEQRPGSPPPEVLWRDAFDALPVALRVIQAVVHGEAGLRSAAHAAAEHVRRTDVAAALREMPLDSLKATTTDRLMLGPLQRAEITTVAEVIARGRSLDDLPGVGPVSARRILGAAHAIQRALMDDIPVLIDVAQRRPDTTELLRRLAAWDAGRRTRGAAGDLERARELAGIPAMITRRTTSILAVPLRALPVGELRESIGTVERRAGLLQGTRTGERPVAQDPWDDFVARAADYFAMLSELGFGTEDENKAHGDLPQEIVDAVRDQPLDSEYLTASLRGYQSFGARFALVQRKVVIGDEMGLGKTLEAIAVLAHLRSRGETHFLVVCPAAVVTNWTREIAGKSRLTAHRVHGPDREHAERLWRHEGGVAVTTYETLAWWERALALTDPPACVVVDEAHYIKNPEAARSRRASALVGRSERAILLTGTPLENRVEEFRTLVGYLRPDIALRATSFSPDGFRRQVAPAYLRRNQEDVLTELPELIEVEEWLPLSAADRDAYDDAVLEGNFMAMRQAAMLQGKQSEKLERLIEIVEEAEENQRRVIVFSYFRDVLAEVAAALPGQVHGPLSGSVPAHRRQTMVDEFSAARHGAVLVAQIEAGGVGLNIQAASVVVLCEPQLKPTVEAQAVARAHRMGQVHSVQVHRLLSEDTVDERITEILERKRELFDEYARVSATADASPEAVDLSDAELVRQLVTVERERVEKRRAAG